MSRIEQPTNATTVQSGSIASSPRSGSSVKSAKRQFEKVLSEIRNLASAAKLTAGEHQDHLIQKSEKNSNKQWWSHLKGNVTQMVSTTIAIGFAGLTGKPDQAQFYVKAAEFVKGWFELSQYDFQMEKEKIQHANAQWNEWIKDLQQLVQNIDTQEQRRNALEDAANR